MFSDPVFGAGFFGRQDIIDLLVKRANGLKSGYRQNVALIGHRQLGKTSILQHFLHTYKDPQVLSVYVEIKPQALDYFVDQFVRSLLYQVLLPLGPVNPFDSLSNLTQQALPVVPKTVARIAEINDLLKRRHAEEAYSKLFELTSIVGQETGKNCIVVLDEFHRLGEFGIRNAFSDFGRRIMVQKDTMYLLSSSSFTASRKILAEKLSLLFGHFERFYLEPFTFETCFELIDKKLSPATASVPVKSFLAAFTDGQPFYLNLIAESLERETKAKGEAVLTKETVAQVFSQLLFQSQGSLNQYFLSLITPWSRMRQPGSHLPILVKLAGGKNKLKDIADSVNRSQRETSKQLNDLMEHELILKTGVFYRFHDKMFKFWLKEVYERKELSLLEVEAREKDFLAAVLSQIEQYEEVMRLSYPERISGLFGLFRNEIIEFGEKKRKLPHFTELVPFQDAALPETPADTRKIIAKGHGRCWVCKITEEKATENEVAELVSLARTKKNDTATRVLVALNGLDENAKLLAKEKKIFTLSLSRVNMLMDLYGKHPIVK